MRGRFALVGYLLYVVSCGGDDRSENSGSDTVVDVVTDDIDSGGTSLPDAVEDLQDELTPLEDTKVDLEDLEVQQDGFADSMEVEVTSPPEVDYLVLYGDGLEELASAWGDYRTESGHVVHVESFASLVAPDEPALNDEVAVGIVQEWVRGFYEQRDFERPFYLLILSDAVYEGSAQQGMVPSGFWPGLWQQCYSDNFYADMDGDHVPDLDVGRIPVHTVEEGMVVLDKVIEHETEYEVGPWNNRFTVYAGDPGFGGGIDSAIETIAQQGLESIPYNWEMLFTYAVSSSPYFYAPMEEKVLDLLTMGSVMATYMGHGGGEFNVPSLEDVVVQHRYPMCAFFACTTGDYLGSSDSDPEIVMKRSGSPMAFLVSQDVTHPYSNHIQTMEMEAYVFTESPETFGEAIRQSKWLTMYNDNEDRQFIAEMALLFMEEWEEEATLIDQQYAYNLLGDPAILMRMPPVTTEIAIDDGV